MKISIMILLMLFTGCSSTRLTNSYRNNQISSLSIEPILIVGMSPNPEARKMFEYLIQKSLRIKNIEAVPSLEIWSNADSLYYLSFTEIAQLEKQALSRGFNTILLAKVLSVENIKSNSEHLAYLHRLYNSFKQDYFDNQYLIIPDNEEETSKIFHSETALYYTDEVNGGQLIWRGMIDILDPQNPRVVIKQYIKLLISNLEKDNILQK